MKLIDPNTGKMECRVCGSIHWANLKRGGGYHRGAWQCCDQNCPNKSTGLGYRKAANPAKRNAAEQHAINLRDVLKLADGTGPWHPLALLSRCYSRCSQRQLYPDPVPVLRVKLMPVLLPVTRHWLTLFFTLFSA